MGNCFTKKKGRVSNKGTDRWTQANLYTRKLDKSGANGDTVICLFFPEAKLPKGKGNGKARYLAEQNDNLSVLLKCLNE